MTLFWCERVKRYEMIIYQECLYDTLYNNLKNLNLVCICCSMIITIDRISAV